MNLFTEIRRVFFLSVWIFLSTGCEETPSVDYPKDRVVHMGGKDIAYDSEGRISRMGDVSYIYEGDARKPVVSVRRGMIREVFDMEKERFFKIKGHILERSSYSYAGGRIDKSRIDTLFIWSSNSDKSKDTLCFITDFELGKYTYDSEGRIFRIDYNFMDFNSRIKPEVWNLEGKFCWMEYLKFKFFIPAAVEYSYYEDGNISSVLFYDYVGNSSYKKESCKFEYADYDDKINPRYLLYKNLGGIPNVLVGHNISPNNPCRIVSYSAPPGYLGIKGLKTGLDLRVEYEYDSFGFPYRISYIFKYMWTETEYEIEEVHYR